MSSFMLFSICVSYCTLSVESVKVISKEQLLVTLKGGIQIQQSVIE